MAHVSRRCYGVKGLCVCVCVCGAYLLAGGGEGGDDVDGLTGHVSGHHDRDVHLVRTKKGGGRRQGAGEGERWVEGGTMGVWTYVVGTGHGGHTVGGDEHVRALVQDTDREKQRGEAGVRDGKAGLRQVSEASLHMHEAAS